MASALLSPLSALVGAALGAVVRHSAAAMVSGVVILQILPVAVSERRHWSAVIAHTLPCQAWLRLVDIPYGLGGTHLPLDGHRGVGRVRGLGARRRRPHRDHGAPPRPVSASSAVTTGNSPLAGGGHEDGSSAVGSRRGGTNTRSARVRVAAMRTALRWSLPRDQARAASGGLP